jgi:hypothetical protein
MASYPFQSLPSGFEAARRKNGHRQSGLSGPESAQEQKLPRRAQRSPVRLRFHVGTLISQTSPSERQSKSTLPPSGLIVPSMRRLPKPLRSGAFTLGPPNSVQWSASCPSSLRDHVNLIWPFGLDSAPYLEALVASSCKTTAIACAAVDSNTVLTRLADPPSAPGCRAHRDKGGELLLRDDRDFGAYPSCLDKQRVNICHRLDAPADCALWALGSVGLRPEAPVEVLTRFSAPWGTPLPKSAHGLWSPNHSTNDASVAGGSGSYHPPDRRAT